MSVSFDLFLNTRQHGPMSWRDEVRVIENEAEKRCMNSSPASSPLLSYPQFSKHNYIKKTPTFVKWVCRVCCFKKSRPWLWMVWVGLCDCKKNTQQTRMVLACSSVLHFTLYFHQNSLEEMCMAARLQLLEKSCKHHPMSWCLGRGSKAFTRIANEFGLLSKTGPCEG
jgi:hypothetical protein